MGAGGEALLDIDGLVHGTCVPGIHVLSVTWDLCSSMVLTRYIRFFIGVENMVVGQRFHDNAQVVAWPDSMNCLEFGVYSDQEINGVQ